jgi:hypothetical protein
VSVLAEGPFPHADAVKQYLVERYEEDGAEVTPQDEATAKTCYVFRIAEVHDDLVPASAKVLLLQGTCDITVVHEGEEVLRTAMRSKVISGTDRQRVLRTITDYLEKKAYEASARSLDGALFEAGKD